MQRRREKGEEEEEERVWRRVWTPTMKRKRRRMEKRGRFSHEAALPLDFVCPLLLVGPLAVDVEAHVPPLLQVEQLLEELLDIVVHLGRGLHEGALPLLGHGLALFRLHLALRLVALVAHQHDGDALHAALDLHDLLVDGLQLLQGLLAGDGEDQDEGVALGDGEALHGRELVAPRGVGDLQGADALVAADDLPVGVLDRRDVRVAESAFDKAQDQGALAHAAGPEDHHAVIIALFRHLGRGGPLSHLGRRRKREGSQAEEEATFELTLP